MRDKEADTEGLAGRETKTERWETEIDRERETESIYRVMWYRATDRQGGRKIGTGMEIKSEE